jgi:hypothetical protein
MFLFPCSRDLVLFFRITALPSEPADRQQPFNLEGRCIQIALHRPFDTQPGDESVGVEFEQDFPTLLFLNTICPTMA